MHHPYLDRVIKKPDPEKTEFDVEKSKTEDTPGSTIATLVNSLDTFDAVVEKVVQMNNNGKWISQEATGVVRVVLKAIAEVNKSKGACSLGLTALRAGKGGEDE